MEILTQKLRELAEKVSPGVGNVKMLPATSYLKIYGENGKLSLTATDGVNFLTVSGAISSNEVFGPVVVRADSLLKLPAKTTKEVMKLNVKAEHMDVIGNGTYKVPIISVDEFPTISFVSVADLSDSANPDLIKRMFAVNKSAIAVDMSYPFLTGYYVKDGVVTTDRNRMCINKSEGMFSGNNVLLSQRMVDLVGGFRNTMAIQISAEGNLKFASADMTLIGPQLSGLGDYPNLENLFAIAPEGRIVFNRVEMLTVLDRVMLFVDSMDNYGIYLTFTQPTEVSNGELVITDLKNNSIESIKFSGWTGNDFRICLNTKYLMELLATLTTDTVEIQYQEGLPLKVEEGNITFLLCVISPDVAG